MEGSVQQLVIIMKKIFLTSIILISLISPLKASLKAAAYIFDFPLAENMNIQNISLNGQDQIFVNFASEVSFNDLMTYYHLLLKEDGWSFLDLEKIFSLNKATSVLLNMQNMPEQAAFLKDGYIILFRATKIHGINKIAYSVAIREFLPPPLLSTRKDLVKHVEGLEFPNSIALVQFDASILGGDRTILACFSAKAPPHQTRLFFREGLHDRGWVYQELWETMKAEFYRFAGYMDLSMMENIDFYQKDDKILFFFTGRREEKDTVFGYLIKDFENTNVIFNNSKDK